MFTKLAVLGLRTLTKAVSMEVSIEGESNIVALLLLVKHVGPPLLLGTYTSPELCDLGVFRL